MYSHFFIGVFLLIGITAFLIKFLKASFTKKYPQCDPIVINNTLGLTVLELGITAFPFVSLWSFLPRKNFMDILASDMAKWDIDPEPLYQMQTVDGLTLLIWGSLSIFIIYLLFQGNSSKFSLIKILSIINIVNVTIIVWKIVGSLVLWVILQVFGKFLLEMGEIVYFVVLGLIALAFLGWIIFKAIKIQKSFNKDLYELNFSEAIVSPEKNSDISTPEAPSSPVLTHKPTRDCPYCGETILAVAKKCKHCGEWIKEEAIIESLENVIIESSKNDENGSNAEDQIQTITPQPKDEQTVIVPTHEAQSECEQINDYEVSTPETPATGAYTEEPHFIDLGLSVKWAANSSGIAVPQTDSDVYKFILNDGTSVSADDFLHNAGIQIPDIKHFEELIERCQWSLYQEDGNSWYKIVGPSGNTISFPITATNKLLTSQALNPYMGGLCYFLTLTTNKYSLAKGVQTKSLIWAIKKS